jgi:hypothetical protein
MPCRTRMRPPRFRAKNLSACTRSSTARGSSMRANSPCEMMRSRQRPSSAPRKWTRFRSSIPAGNDDRMRMFTKELVVATRRDLRNLDSIECCTPAGDSDDSDDICARCRPRLSLRAGPPGRNSHRVHLHRSGSGGRMAGVAHRSRPVYRAMTTCGGSNHIRSGRYS